MPVKEGGAIPVGPEVLFCIMEEPFLGDLYRNPHRLSLCGKIILFDCKRPSATKGGERSELTYHNVSFDRTERRFVKAAADGAAVISARKSARAQIVKCKCVINVHKRVSTPCVLVAKKGEKGASFHYSLHTLSNESRLESCIEFKVPYDISKTVCILHGPTVLWSHAGNVFYTSPQAGEVRQIPFPVTKCIFGELPLSKEEVFVLGLQNSLVKSINDQPPSQTLGYFVDSAHVFDGTVILPHPYICVTRCILVLSAENQDSVLKSAVVAATSNQQLVYFENGIVKETCQLPFEEPEEIQVVNTGRNGCLFVITFHQDHVCAVWKDTFQISSRWSDVSSVLVDDFVGCGTDQMLLVFKDQGKSGQPLEKFLLTDLCGISYASCQQDNRAPGTSPQENNLLTLKALESRLQSGLTVLQEFQREERVKERVLQQSLRALTEVVSGREPVVTQPEQEGLVALWDCDDESNDEDLDDKMQDMPAVPSKPQVDKLWHRIAEERVVVGVMLTTDSSIPVASVSLSILTEMGQSSTPAVIQTKSQVFRLPALFYSSSSSSSSSSPACTFPEPAAKRSRQHNNPNTHTLAVTAATRLTPLLNSGCVKCRVMLHYMQGRDTSALLCDQTPSVLHCGEVNLDFRCDFPTQLLKSPELNTVELREDLLTLLTLLDCWIFHIDSPDHSLCDVECWIQKTVGCKRVEVSPRYLLLNSAGKAADMLLRWNQMTPFQGELSVHSSQIQMLQFLDSFLAFLPASCSIQHVSGTAGQEAAQILSLALEKEVVSLRECVSSLLCEDEEEEKEKRKQLGKEQSPDPGSAEGLQKVREMWQQDVERSKRRLSPLVDVGRYCKLSQNLSKVQLGTDLAALLDTQRTLFS